MSSTKVKHGGQAPSVQDMRLAAPIACGCYMLVIVSRASYVGSWYPLGSSSCRCCPTSMLAQGVLAYPAASVYVCQEPRIPLASFLLPYRLASYPSWLSCAGFGLMQAVGWGVWNWTLF